MFDPLAAAVILAELEDGKSLRAAAKEAGVAPSSVMHWLDRDDYLMDGKTFAEQYAQARAKGYAILGDELVEISDEQVTTVRRGKHEPNADDPDAPVEVVYDATAVARNRLRVDTRKWLLAKMLPKLYGEKVDHNVSGELNFTRIERVITKPVEGPNE